MELSYLKTPMILSDLESRLFGAEEASYQVEIVAGGRPEISHVGYDCVKEKKCLNYHSFY